jgi:hypothetical protein
MRKHTAPVRFALVETKPTEEQAAPIELILVSGERLRIPQDAAALKLVLAVLRQPA